MRRRSFTFRARCTQTAASANAGEREHESKPNESIVKRRSDAHDPRPGQGHERARRLVAHQHRTQLCGVIELVVELPGTPRQAEDRARRAVQPQRREDRQRLERDYSREQDGLILAGSQNGSLARPWHERNGLLNSWRLVGGFVAAKSGTS